MKKHTYKLLLPLLFLTSSIFAQDGIKFLDAEFGEVLALAELEGKLVFLDAYTDWCKPCKKMDKEVFTKKEVGDFYNTHFVSIKINMEEGTGPKLADKYFIYAYPSLLFLNYDGSVAHRYAGFQDKNGILSLGNTAIDDSSNLASLAKKYENGDRSPEFLLEYLQASFVGADGKHVKILEDYLATQKDWNTPQSMDYIFNLLDTPNSPLFDHLVNYQKSYAEVYGEAGVKSKIRTLVYESLGKGKVKLEDADQLFSRAYPKNAKKLAAQYKMGHHQQQENGAGYAAAAMDYVKHFPNISSEELNDISWGFYDFVEEKKALKKASKWAKKAIKKDNSYVNNEVLAALYHKLGKSGKALKVAEKAINIAKQSGEDFRGVTELIHEIKGE